MALKGIPKFNTGATASSGLGPAAQNAPVQHAAPTPPAQPQQGYPQQGYPQQQATQQAQAAPTQGRRFSIGQKPADYGTAPAAIDDAPEQKKVKGAYHCYVSGVRENKKGRLQAVLNVHDPGGEAHGARAFVDLAFDATSNGAYFARKRIVDFFTTSGFPETRWPAGASGGKVPPIVDLFTLPVDLDGGGRVRVPVMLIGEFDIEIDKKDNQKSYQRVKSAKMHEPYHAAPVMKYCDAWVADMCGWPFSHGDYSAVVDANELAGQFADFGLFQPEGHFEPL